MNDRQKLALKYLRDPRGYLEAFTKIKSKGGGALIPFKANNPQLDLFNTLSSCEKIKLAILKARQLGFCAHPEHRVLTADLTWVAIDDLQVGDEVVSVDEYPPGGRGKERKMKTSVVEAKADTYQRAYKVSLADGSSLVLTEDHRMLSTERGTTRSIWRKVSETSVGDVVRRLTDVWGDPDYEDGWMAGMMDGEGSLSKSSRTGAQICISQVNGPVWERVVHYLTDNGYAARVEVDRRLPGVSSKLGSKVVNKAVVGRMDQLFQLLGKTRPSRFMGRRFWEGKTLPNGGWVRVVAIEELPAQRMVDVQTSSGTYVLEGFVSHNSTGVVGYFYHDTITTPGTTTAFIGYNSELTADFLDKVKMFWKSTPDELKPTLQYNSKYEISFPAIDSKIIVLPSTENVGRGYAIQNCLLSEFAFWQKADEKLASLIACVHKKMVVETTPSEVGTPFHKLWVEDNDWLKKEYGWWWGYTEDEIESIRRNMNDEQRFDREFNLQFDSTGRSIFDRDALKRQLVNRLVVGAERTLKDGTKWRVCVEDGLRMYAPPQPGAAYCAAADIAEGVTGGNYSVFIIFDRMTGEEVAFYRGHVPPDVFGEMLDRWGRKYNNAYMAPEVNNHGLTTLTILKQKLYPSLYFRPSKYDAYAQEQSSRLGWKTTVVTRPILIDDLAKALREDAIVIHSKELHDEMTVMIYDERNRPVAPASFHDDTVFAAGIALQTFSMMATGDLTQISHNDVALPSFH